LLPLKPLLLKNELHTSGKIQTTKSKQRAICQSGSKNRFGGRSASTGENKNAPIDSPIIRAGGIPEALKFDKKTSTIMKSNTGE